MPHPSVRRPARFTKTDLDLINAALALYEAEVEGEEPDAYRDDDAYDVEYAAWERRLNQLRAVRVKVHDRLG